MRRVTEKLTLQTEGSTKYLTSGVMSLNIKDCEKPLPFKILVYVLPKQALLFIILNET